MLVICGLCVCVLQGPDGNLRPVKVVDNGDGTYGATFIPDDCGRYKLDVKYAGKEISKAPIPVQAYATGNVRALDRGGTWIKFLACRLKSVRSQKAPRGILPAVKSTASQ